MNAPGLIQCFKILSEKSSLLQRGEKSCMAQHLGVAEIMVMVTVTVTANIRGVPIMCQAGCRVPCGSDPLALGFQPAVATENPVFSQLCHSPAV